MDEKEILLYWKKKGIFTKSLQKRKKAPRFVFYEGPPFANARPGLHHVLARSYKDLILRYKTMAGFFVPRKAGWDTHGLPTEMAVEKQLQIRTKKEVEKIGIEKFVKKCQENIFSYKKEWEQLTERIGYFLDLKNAYITCDAKYIESVWWLLKEIYNRGLIYQDYKVVPFCPRCGTSLSDHEVAQGYRNVVDPSVYVKFILKSKILNHKSSLLVWTTTPWTLPANTGLAVHPETEYCQIKIGKEYLILAQKRLEVIKEKYQIIATFLGKKLKDLSYYPLFSFEDDSLQGKGYRVVTADFVNLEEGTGVVHIAPAYGEEDLNLAKKEHLPVLSTVNEEGRIKENVKQFQGKFVKDADKLIIDDLHQRKLLYRSETIRHDYPFCWRCDTPLLYFAKNSWYIKTTAVKDKMLDANGKIRWVPAYIKNGRFGNWLKENVDWTISRERFWGTPLPIWKCVKCRALQVIGSLEELNKLTQGRYHLTLDSDLHRPFLDKVVFACKECGGEMRRIPEVLDCWFDSGAMPYAQWHYPFENQKQFQESFPADFIAEGIDQTRGWFYTLLAISTLLGLKPAYKNVISLGLLLDEKGQKMSKSRGNVIFPETMLDKYGADAVRFYFYLLPQGETVRFAEKELLDVYRKLIVTLENCLMFYQTYADIQDKKEEDSFTLLDQWIQARFDQVLEEVTQSLNQYEVTAAARKLFQFIVEDLSNWYLRRSRKRKSKIFYRHLREMLIAVSKICAPFIPFLSEHIFRTLTQKESVHLEDWPKPFSQNINQELLEKMAMARKICELGLSLRAQNQIKVRQPLAELRIENQDGFWQEEKDAVLKELIKDELNVKNVTFGKINFNNHYWKEKTEGQIKIALNTKITPQLQEEGLVREIIRIIQTLRKKSSLSPSNKASINFYTTDKHLLGILLSYKEKIEQETNSLLVENQNTKEEYFIEQKPLYLSIVKE
jgi:isoleucyl-tRNA synthetase